MEKHEKFTDWALTQGVKINGIAAHKFPGRGLGIVAKKKHQVLEVHPCCIYSSGLICLYCDALLLHEARLCPLSWLKSSDFEPYRYLVSHKNLCQPMAYQVLFSNNTQAGSRLVTVPRSALRTVYTVPKSISDLIGPITVHGLLAAELALDTSPEKEPWRNVCNFHLPITLTSTTFNHNKM